MDVREIKKLIALMNANGLSRLEVEEEGERRHVILEKGGYAPAAPMPYPGQGPAALPPASGDAPDPKRAAVEDTVTFNSPMVGTFYRASTPDSESFAKPGDHVRPDSTLCIIEAMKVFNEIRAEMSGTIVEVLAENSEAVEYNQPLFLIKPD